jgi:hypothetical protein
MGLLGWMTPAEWPGYLLPISLMAFLLALVTLIINLNLKRGSNL